MPERLLVGKVRSAFDLFRRYARQIPSLGFGASTTIFLAEASMRRPLSWLVHPIAPSVLTIAPAGYCGRLTLRRAETDSAVIRQVLGTEAYRSTPTLSKARLVVDCGANIGVSAYYFLHRYPSARVIAVEPDAQNYELCRRNLASFGNRAIVLRGALWSDCQPLRIVPSSRARGAWALRVEPVTSGVAEVEGFTLREILSCAGQRPPIDVLKIDIEGAETEVFRDSPEWLNYVRHIAIELHGRDAEAAFFGALSAFAYERRCVGEVTFVDDLEPLATAAYGGRAPRLVSA